MQVDDVEVFVEIIHDYEQEKLYAACNYGKRHHYFARISKRILEDYSSIIGHNLNIEKQENYLFNKLPISFARIKDFDWTNDIFENQIEVEKYLHNFFSMQWLEKKLTQIKFTSVHKRS